MPAKLDRVRLDYKPSPIRLLRPKALARLFGVDTSTIWRWRKAGILPAFIQIGPNVGGLTEEQVKTLLEQRQTAAAQADSRN